MRQDRSGKGMDKIIKDGWDDKAGSAESPEALLKDAVFAIRRDIDATRHQFEESDGSVRKVDPKGGTGSFQSIEEVQRWRDGMVEEFRKERTMLSDALVKVEYEALPNMQKPDIQYLNQVGGAYNLVAHLLADEVSKMVTDVKQLDSIQRNFMRIFWHSGGWEGLVQRARRRIEQSEK